MTDKPIIFSGPMVRAILDGSKTQTRRVLKDQPQWVDDAWWWQSPRYDNGLGADYFHTRCVDGIMPSWVRAMPIAVGDLLWVREPWQVWAEFDDFMPSELPQNYDRGDVLYLADRPDTPWASRKRHARFMPRRFSRITLKVTDVRVQRVQSISEEDAEAEGAPPILVPPDGGSCPCKEGFEKLWNSIHGPDAWDRNPWVAAYTFEPIFKNINEVKR